MQRDPAPEEAGIVLGTGTQIQDTVDPACDGVVSWLPLPPSPHQCLLQRDILCTQKPFQAWELPLWGSRPQPTTANPPRGPQATFRDPI